jgi:ABC-type multidrug transport system fused ATPase/permease subunit
MRPKSTISKLISLMSPSQKSRGAWLTLGLFVSSLLEAFGIGLIFPVILAAMSPERLMTTFPFLAGITSFASITQPSQSMLPKLMAVLLIFFLAKNIFITIIAYWRSKFIFNCRTQISNRLFQIYLRQPYTFHLQRNTAELSNNIANETITFAFDALAPAIFLFSELLVATSILLVLLFIQPAATLFVFGVFTLAAVVVFFLTHQRLAFWGKERQRHGLLRFHHMKQGLEGVKEVKVLRLEKYFSQRFEFHDEALSNYYKKQDFFAQLPRVWLELFVVIGILGIVWLLYRQSASQDILPTIGIFIAAAFRMFPSVNRMFSALQQLKLGQATVETLFNEITTLEQQMESSPDPHRSPVRFKQEIVINHVSYRYPNTQTNALNNISLSISKGQFIAITGASGSGKTTLLDMLLGLLPPHQGQITADQIDIRDHMNAWQANIGYLPQSTYLTDDTIKANIAFGIAAEQVDMERVSRAIKLAQLDHWVSSLPQQLETMVGERGVCLSGGQKQRIGIARALYHDPDILILDEATSALDSRTEESVIASILALRGQKTIIFVTHRKNFLHHCDHVYEFQNGQLFTSTQYGVN